MAVYQNKSAIARDVSEKRGILRDRYGGLMTLNNLMEELGYDCPASARRAVEAMDIPATKIGKSKKYDTDIVARRLVELRGMC